MSKCATGWGLTTGQENLEAISARMGEQWGQVGVSLETFRRFGPGKTVKIRSCRWNFGEVETWRWEGRKSSIKKPGDGFKLILVFPCLFFFELSCFGYLFGACFASIIQLGDIPNTYINIHLFKGVYIGLISKGVPIPRAFPPFCLWIRGFPMLPGY